MNAVHTVLCSLLVLASTHIMAESPTRTIQKPQVLVDENGVVRASDVSLPLSEFMSPEAKQWFIDRQFLEQIVRSPNRTAAEKDTPESISDLRKRFDIWLRPKVDRARVLYPVTVEDRKLAGVPVQIVMPKEGIPESNQRRVLIHLHGGGFRVGSGLHALVESIPVASVGKFKVISVDYRMAPEFKFPAASEDVAAVYRELLNTYDARSIGLYGCSSGGTLSAMAAAWFQTHELPTPGAIALLGAAAFGNFQAPGSRGSWNGDSAYLAPAWMGGFTVDAHARAVIPADAYLSTADLGDPLVSPALWPAVLARFPPTLLVTGTRAWDMSAAVQTHRELVKARVEAQLHLWDGMAHCFVMDTQIPESREAFDVMARFFETHLAAK